VAAGGVSFIDGPRRAGDPGRHTGSFVAVWLTRFIPLEGRARLSRALAGPRRVGAFAFSGGDVVRRTLTRASGIFHHAGRRRVLNQPGRCNGALDRVFGCLVFGDLLRGGGGALPSARGPKTSGLGAAPPPVVPLPLYVRGQRPLTGPCWPGLTTNEAT